MVQWTKRLAIIFQCSRAYCDFVYENKSSKFNFIFMVFWKTCFELVLLSFNCSCEFSQTICVHRNRLFYFLYYVWGNPRLTTEQLTNPSRTRFVSLNELRKTHVSKMWLSYAYCVLHWQWWGQQLHKSESYRMLGFDEAQQTIIYSQEVKIIEEAYGILTADGRNNETINLIVLICWTTNT